MTTSNNQQKIKTLSAQEMFARKFNGDNGLAAKKIITRKKINRATAYEIAVCYTLGWQEVFRVTILETEPNGDIKYRTDLINRFNLYENALGYVAELKTKMNKKPATFETDKG